MDYISHVVANTQTVGMHIALPNYNYIASVYLIITCRATDNYIGVSVQKNHVHLITR